MGRNSQRVPRWTPVETDVHYWELELLAAVKRHDAAIDALHLASDELYDVGKRLTVARERLVQSRRSPTPIGIHPKWRKEAVS